MRWWIKQKHKKDHWWIQPSAFRAWLKSGSASQSSITGVAGGVDNEGCVVGVVTWMQCQWEIDCETGRWGGAQHGQNGGWGPEMSKQGGGRDCHHWWVVASSPLVHGGAGCSLPWVCGGVGHLLPWVCAGAGCSLPLVHDGGGSSLTFISGGGGPSSPFMSLHWVCSSQQPPWGLSLHVPSNLLLHNRLCQRIHGPEAWWLQPKHSHFKG